jgi:aspartate aminotransferase
MSTIEFEKMVSERIKVIKPSASMDATEKVAELRRQGKEVINLSIGQPDFNTPDNIKLAGIKAINDNFTGYTSAKGIPELLEAVSKKLLEDNKIKTIPGKNIIITPGIKQALYYVNLCLINPGDEAIILEPYWLTYIDSLKLCGGVPVIVCCKEENNFKPKIEDIEKRITKKTKYILFNNPNNPTGAVWSKSELKKLVEVARKHKVTIVADEIYEHIIFDNNKFISIASLEGADDITITFNGFSKGPAMTGWRLGFIAAPEEIIKLMVKAQQQIATCATSISQKAAVVAYEQKKEIEEMRLIYQKRRDLLVNGLNKIKGFKCNHPEGTFYV